jgi:hypothetical protein
MAYFYFRNYLNFGFWIFDFGFKVLIRNRKSAIRYF